MTEKNRRRVALADNIYRYDAAVASA